MCVCVYTFSNHGLLAGRLIRQSAVEYFLENDGEAVDVSWLRTLCRFLRVQPGVTLVQQLRSRPQHVCRTRSSTLSSSGLTSNSPPPCRKHHEAVAPPPAEILYQVVR